MNALILRGQRLLGVAALVVAASFALTSPVSAAEPDAVVRAAHFSPTTPGVDVYLGSFSGGSSTLWLSGVSYGAVSPYQRITPGLYTLSMRPAGAASTTPPVLTWTLDAQPGKAYTVAGVGSGAAVRGVVIPDDLSTPPAGTGRVRVVQAASRAPVATITASNGSVIARDAAFATTTAYADVPVGTWNLSVQSSGATTSAPVAVAAGASTSVLLLDAKTDGITLRTVLDSSASGTAPAGSVPAGGGGTAGGPAGGSTGGSTGDLDWAAPAVGAGTGGVALLGLGWWMVRRRELPVARHAA